jgi:hypothetical protein
MLADPSHCCNCCNATQRVSLKTHARKVILAKACEKAEATYLGKARGGEVTLIAFPFERLDMHRWIFTSEHGSAHAIP